MSKNTIKAWKDLPSENWAEMMEFWHCHKPHDHDQRDPESLASKGYGANNAISAQPGIGFVDLTSFLFAESDCDGLKVSLITIATIFPPIPHYIAGKKKVAMSVTNRSVTWPPIQLPEKVAFVDPTRGRARHRTLPREWVSCLVRDAVSFFHPVFSRNRRLGISKKHIP